MNPEISIIIITKNRAGFIAKAVESVQKQTFSSWELLVLDDDSNDDTGGIIEAFKAKDSRIKYYKNSPALGIPKNRNKGVSLANGKYIAMLDSDDYWTDINKLEKQISIFNSDSTIGMVGSSMTLVREDGSIIEDWIAITDDYNIRKNMLTENQFMQSSIVFKKDIFNKVGGYNENYDVAEDFDLWLKMGKESKFANLKESTLNYLVHSSNISKSKLKMAKAVDSIIEKYKKDYPSYWTAKLISIARIIKSYF
jgi:glycosyltransferase involved in cell wall biosynthesis